MRYGAVVRPPTLEAKLRSASAGEAEQIEGVEQFVINVESGFAGVVAKTRRRGLVSGEGDADRVG